MKPFLADVPILYPLKTPENQRFSVVFRGYKLGTLARYGLRKKIIRILTFKILFAFSFSANTYLFKINNRNTRKRCEYVQS